MSRRSEGGARPWMSLARGLAVATFLSAAAMTFALGCGDTAAPGGSGGGGSPPTAAFAESACGVCLTDACEEAIDRCLTDAGCASYLDCLLGCPVSELGNADSDCDAACVGDESSETTAARMHLQGCRELGPGAECPTCGFPPLSGLPPEQVCEERVAPTPCRQCFWDHCCDTWDACFDGNDPDCDALANCVDPCDKETLSAPCIESCFAEHPASVQKFVDQSLCASAQCANEQKEGDAYTCDASQRNDCEVCWYDTCGPQLQLLMATPPGYLTWMCTAGDCGDIGAGPDCYKACTESYPEAKEAFLLWAECVDYSCIEACPG